MDLGKGGVHGLKDREVAVVMSFMREYFFFKKNSSYFGPFHAILVLKGH